VSRGDRVEAMAARLTDTIVRYGFPQSEVDQIVRAYWLGMERRSELTEHHPAQLHPARTMLILLHDCDVRSADVLSAAAVVDTAAPRFAVPESAVTEQLGSAVAEIAAAVPTPQGAGEELLEQLLVAERAVQLVALAERLDFARHLHLLPDENWPREHMLVSAVYLPLAQRTDALLGRRFARWVDAFARRRLER
jgi:hypothetical protein